MCKNSPSFFNVPSRTWAFIFKFFQQFLLIVNTRKGFLSSLKLKLADYSIAALLFAPSASPRALKLHLLVEFAEFSMPLCWLNIVQGTGESYSYRADLAKV